MWRRADLWTEYERSNQRCEENENRRSKSMPDLEDGIEEKEEETDEKEEERDEKKRAESDTEHLTMMEKRVRELSVIEDSVCFMQERKGVAPAMKYRRISDSLMNDILEDNHNVYEFASKELDVSEAESYVQNLPVRRNAIGYEDRKESYAQFMNYLRNKLIAEMF